MLAQTSKVRLHRIDATSGLSVPETRASKSKLSRLCFRKIQSIHIGDDGSLGQEPGSNSNQSNWAPLQEHQPPAPRRVLTKRGIPTFRQPIPENPCEECQGTGKKTCGTCRGKGRLNFQVKAILPSGAWPQWCPSCRATGRWVCERCMGTGVHREPIGFRV